MGFSGVERAYGRRTRIADKAPRETRGLRVSLMDVVLACALALALSLFLRPAASTWLLSREKTAAIAEARAAGQSLLAYAEDSEGTLPSPVHSEPLLPLPRSADYRWAINACLSHGRPQGLGSQVVLAAQAGYSVQGPSGGRTFPAGLMAPDRLHVEAEPGSAAMEFRPVSQRYAGASVYALMDGSVRVLPESLVRIGNDGPGCNSAKTGLTGLPQQARFAQDDASPGTRMTATAMAKLKERLERMAERERRTRAEERSRKKAQVASMQPASPGLPL